MSVRDDDVRKVAALARLGVSDREVEALTRELNGILAHMDILSAVDTGDADQRDEPASSSLLRADEGPSVALERPAESFAPLTRDGFFVVPRLDSHDDAGSAA
ncbi:MAG: Asp-tRNA(Asn)/Glu-tRNA(Gln) amidotransferase subunit GatC [Gemmatimonadaceae bacterium]